MRDPQRLKTTYSILSDGEFDAISTPTRSAQRRRATAVFREN
jgi:hypothetical protein